MWPALRWLTHHNVSHVSSTAWGGTHKRSVTSELFQCSLLALNRFRSMVGYERKAEDILITLNHPLIILNSEIDFRNLSWVRSINTCDFGARCLFDRKNDCTMLCSIRVSSCPPEQRIAIWPLEWRSQACREIHIHFCIRVPLQKICKRWHKEGCHKVRMLAADSNTWKVLSWTRVLTVRKRFGTLRVRHFRLSELRKR